MVVWFEANREGRISAASSAPKPADTSATLASERLEAARACGAVDRVDRSPLYALGALTDVRANVDAAIGILVRQLRLGRPQLPDGSVIRREIGRNHQQHRRRKQQQCP